MASVAKFETLRTQFLFLQESALEAAARGSKKTEKVLLRAAAEIRAQALEVGQLPLLPGAAE